MKVAAIALVLGGIALLGLKGRAGVSASSRMATSAGSPPRACPAGPPPHNVNPAGGSWIGTGPVQAISMWQGQQAILPVGQKDPHGYAQKVLWMVRRSLRQDVTVRGWNLQTGARVWFQLAGPGTDQPIGYLDHRYPNAINNAPLYRPWNGYASAIIVPSAGCYVLYAQWRSAGWVVPFAVPPIGA